jgi:type IX secretion system PorP/SprF family membrane protein
MKQLSCALLVGMQCLLALSATAQDPQLSQPYGAPLYLNPAFAGYEGCSRVALSYRNQWPEDQRNFQTVLFSYDQHVRQLWGGIGVTFMYDDAYGIEQSMAASVIYSPTFKLFGDKLMISPSTEIGWNYGRGDIQDLYDAGSYPRTGNKFEDIGGRPASQIMTKHFIDVSLGLVLSHNHFTYGFAAHHIARPDVGYAGVSRLPRRLTAHISYRAKLNERITILPSFIYIDQESFHTFLPTIALSLWGARFGAGIRATEKELSSVILPAGYARKWFSIGYIYDITVSSLGNSATGGSHEVNLQFRFNCKNKERGQKGDSLWGM